MPKVNQTMLDKLVDAFKGGSQGTPFREMKIHGEFTDPMVKARVNQQLAGNRLIKLDPSWRTPERVKYQKGIDALIDVRKKPLQEKYDDSMGELTDLQDEFENAFDEAKENYIEQVRDNMESMHTPDIRGGFDPSYDFDVNMGRESLESYWPDYDYKPVSYYNSRGAELGDMVSEYEGRLESMDEPAYRMAVQRQTPRYRRYQDAMQRRDINRRAGRVNAAIMNLARQGYSLPEIREILRRQGR